MARPKEKPTRPLSQAEIAAQQDGTRFVTGRDTLGLPQYGPARNYRGSRFSA